MLSIYRGFAFLVLVSMSSFSALEGTDRQIGIDTCSGSAELSYNNDNSDVENYQPATEGLASLYEMLNAETLPDETVKIIFPNERPLLLPIDVLPDLFRDRQD